VGIKKSSEVVEEQEIEFTTQVSVYKDNSFMELQLVHMFLLEAYKQESQLASGHYKHKFVPMSF